MFRRFLLAGAITPSPTTALAQRGQPQQKQDEFGNTSAPGQVNQSPINAPMTPVQSPTITNNPEYARQPASAPFYAQPAGAAQAPQRAPQAPSQTPTEQRGRGAFTAPGVTQDRSSERNEFQQLISSSSGHVLPLFGQNLFDAPSTFAPVENIPVTGDYVIGPGDELLIRAWGQIEVDFRAPVNRNGMINIPRVGSIPVAGVRYQDLTNHVRTAVSRNFRNFELMVTMGQLRSIQIFVVGHARRPGAYTVSSLATLVNAIFAAGGPALHGSMRSIQVRRGTSPITEFDMYDLLLNGDKSRDVHLLPGDVVYFPPI